MTTTTPLSALRSDEQYYSLELDENQQVPKTFKGRSVLTVTLGVISVLALGFGAGWVFEGNHAATGGAISDDNEVRASVAMTVKIPSTAQKAELVAMCEAWYLCQIGERPVNPITELAEVGPQCIAERAGHMLRWAFHDCGTRSNLAGNGGCHACNIIPFSPQRTCPNNDGLQVEPDSLMGIFEDFVIDPITGEAPVSVADWLHLCAAVGVQLASAEAEKAGIGATVDMITNFEFGRTDCIDQGTQVDAQCGYAKRLPPSRLTWEEMVGVMGDYGFTPMDIPTIMGGHNLGGSGFHSDHNLGTFTAEDGLFGNQYYKSLVHRNWKPRPTRNPAATGNNVQYFGTFHSYTLPPGNVDPVPTGGCPPFNPVGPDGLPLRPAGPLAPECFVDAGNNVICNPCGELMALKTDLELRWTTTSPPGCSLSEADIALGAVPCGGDGVSRPFRNMIDIFANSPTAFATEYAKTHLKMTRFGNAHVKPAGPVPETFVVDIAAPQPAPAPGPAGR